MHRLYNKGFSLIELMIVVAIIAILAAVAIPNYSEYVRKSTLEEGLSVLADHRVKLEQFYQSNRGYGTTGQTPPCGHDGTASRLNVAAANGKFTFTCVLDGTNPNENQSYTLTATGAQGAAVGHVFTLNSSNVKRTTLFKGAVVAKNCWLRSGGEC
jgi:type IV pilus assembly protein PilE